MEKKGKPRLLEAQSIDFSKTDILAVRLENSSLVSVFVTAKNEGALCHFSHQVKQEDQASLFENLLSYIRLHGATNVQIKRISSGHDDQFESSFARFLVSCRAPVEVDEIDVESHIREVFFLPEKGLLRAQKLPMHQEPEVSVDKVVDRPAPTSREAPGNRLFR